MTSPNTIKPAIGLIGCGRMGIGLCRNLLAHGYPVVAMDPHEGNLARAVELGAAAAASLDHLLQSSGVVMTCLPNESSIADVYEGVKPTVEGAPTADSGLIYRAAPGTLLIETSSTNPAHRRELARKAAARGVALVDAPMLKSAADAWAGTIQMLIGGEPEAVERARPVLACVSEKLITVGELGTAHAMKALNNAVTLCNHAILCEVFFAAQRLGIPGDAMFETMRGSMAASYKLEDLAPKLLNNTHPRNTRFAIATKDLETGAELVYGAGLEAPVLTAVLASFQHACRMGGTDDPVSLLGNYLTERTDAGESNRPHP